MAALDQNAIQQGTPGLELMERAGTAMFDTVCSMCEAQESRLDRVVVLCGPGNNGGDGLVIAQRFKEVRREPVVVLASSERYSSDCLIQIQKAGWAGVQILLFGGRKAGASGFKFEEVSETALAKLLSEAGVVVDALLGTAQHAAPRGTIAEILSCLRSATDGVDGRPLLLAADLPTGINADSGELFEPHFRADFTVSVEFAKRGMLQMPAREACGEIEIVPIGIEPALAIEYFLQRADNLPTLAARPPDLHKGQAGRIVIIGGCERYPGAAGLAGHAALRAGAGLVTVAHPAGASYDLIPEIIRLPVGSRTDRNFKATHLKAIVEALKECDAVVLGPGLGSSKPTHEFVKKLLVELERRQIAAVIDADALNIIAELKGFKGCKRGIFTPHPGEASRLLGIKTSAVQANRYAAVAKLQKKLRGVVVLKGAASLVRDAAIGAVNSSGNPFMATAGSGDVLSGLLAALLATNLENFDAARLGVFLHGRAGDLASNEGRLPIIASDVIAAIPQAFGEILQ